MHELLVIGPTAWSERLQRFVSYKRETGMSAAFVALEEIVQQFNGVDVPERIKRAIEMHHRVHHSRYVLLGGDVDQFPVRYIKAINTEWGTNWYPSDLYYADLYRSDGSFDDWDADHDGIEGELDFANAPDHSKFNIDRINVYPDLAVGRVPASNVGELGTYLDKVIAYEFAARESVGYGHPSRWFTRAAFVVDGGKNPFGDPTQSAAQAVPLAHAGFEIIERHQDDPPWDTATPQDRAVEVNRILNNGIGLLHFNGHGNANALAGWYSSSDMGALANQLMLPLVIAQACYTARFHFDLDAFQTAMGIDWTGSAVPKPDRPEPATLQPPKHDRDSLAEEFLVKRATGAVAYIGAVSKHEQGGKALGRYFAEALAASPKPAILGALWQQSLHEFTDNELGGGVIGMGPFYAFIHVHKVMLFGDPSLRLGGLPTSWTPATGGVLPPELVEAAIAT